MRRDGGQDERCVAAVRAGLAGRGDPERAQAQQRYMKSSMPYLGLAMPELRSILRPVLAAEVPVLGSKQVWEAAVRLLWQEATFREERYAALALARHRAAERWRAEGALPLYRWLIETGSWWDLVDEVATHLVRDELLADPDRVAPIMRQWAVDEHLWVRRAAIICQVGAGARVDPALLADVVVPNLEGGVGAGAGGRQDFFIRKGIGWALRDHARTDPTWVAAFVAEHGHAMAGLSKREAAKHLS